jgi:CRP/FNR family cyclic AMP-dependent transcriptional regulator
MTPIDQELANSDALNHLLRFCHIKKYPPKTSFIRSGDKGDRLYYIVQGSASVNAEEDNGEHELILAQLSAGDFIGEIGVFMPDNKRKVTVRSRTECHLAEISYEKLRQVLKNDLREYGIDIMFMLARQLSSRLLVSNRNLCDQVFMDVEGRVARALADLCQKPEAVILDSGIQIRITRQELGQMARCSREMAGRSIKDLEEKKRIIAHGKTIVVLTTH